MKATLYAAVFTETEVEVPESCPKCGADFKEPGNLLSYEYHEVRIGYVVDETGSQIEPDGDGFDSCDDYFPQALYCQCQDWQVVAPLARIDLDDKAKG